MQQSKQFGQSVPTRTHAKINQQEGTTILCIWHLYIWSGKRGANPKQQMLYTYRIKVLISCKPNVLKHIRDRVASSEINIR